MAQSKRYTKVYRGKRFDIMAKSEEEYERKLAIKMAQRDDELDEDIRIVSFREGNYTHAGDVGELEALVAFTRAGFDVSKPLTSNTKYDLIADYDGKLFKVQVKTITSEEEDTGRLIFALRTTEGNHGVSRPYTTEDADVIFIHCINPRWVGLVLPIDGVFPTSVRFFPRTTEERRFLFDTQVKKLIK